MEEYEYSSFILNIIKEKSLKKMVRNWYSCSIRYNPTHNVYNIKPLISDGKAGYRRNKSDGIEPIELGSDLNIISEEELCDKVRKCLAIIEQYSLKHALVSVDPC